MMDLQVLGAKEVVTAFNSMVDAKVDTQVKRGFLNIATSLRDEIKRRVPRGPKKERSWMTMRRGVVAKAFKRQQAHNPAVFVGIDYKIAPHFHLIEFGTVHIAPRYVFRDTVHAYREKTVAAMEEVTWRIMEIAWDRGS